jgi:hypothetical protein
MWKGYRLPPLLKYGGPFSTKSLTPRQILARIPRTHTHTRGRQGGDLPKWNQQSIGHYVGIDIAYQSIRDAIARYNGDSYRAKCGFPAIWSRLPPSSRPRSSSPCGWSGEG